MEGPLTEPELDEFIRSFLRRTEDMVGPLTVVDEFIRSFIRRTEDPRCQMETYVDSLKDDLRSDDPDVRDMAEAKIVPVLSWLLTAPSASDIAKANDDTRQSLRTSLAEQGYPSAFIEKLVRKVSTRDRGRPRTRGMDAVTGLRLHWLERKSWREIVLEISGSCNDRGCKSYCPTCGDVARTTKVGRLGAKKRKQQALCRKCKFRLRPAGEKETVCYKCSDAMADLVKKLEKFLLAHQIAERPLRQTDELGEK